MAFWALAFLFTIVGAWATAGAKVMISKKLGGGEEVEG